MSWLYQALIGRKARFSGRRDARKAPLCNAKPHNSFQPKIFKKQKYARKLHLAASQKTQACAATIREA
jgi:hypothetical protein